MAEFTHDTEYVAIAVAPQSINAEFLNNRLQTACDSAGLVLQGPANLLGRQQGWTAIEYDVRFAESDVQEARSTLAERLGDIADSALLPRAHRRKKLLVSDMDSTIIEQECLDELADFAGLKSEISEVTERAMRGELDFETALRERVAKLKGLSLSALQACFDTKLTLMPGARTLTATMRAHGAYCLLVSGGFTYFTQRVAERAGFQSHRGNSLLDDGSHLTGQVGEPILGREAKGAFLDEAAFANGVTRRDALAMGDGANDLDMIGAAGLGIAVHAKPIVAKAADAAIDRTDLTTALYFQGYHDDEIVWQG